MTFFSLEMSCLATALSNPWSHGVPLGTALGNAGFRETNLVGIAVRQPGRQQLGGRGDVPEDENLQQKEMLNLLLAPPGGRPGAGRPLRSGLWSSWFGWPRGRPFRLEYVTRALLHLVLLPELGISNNIQRAAVEDLWNYSAEQFGIAVRSASS